MRISDWSSDVCSSDLIDQGEAPPLFVVGPEGGAELVNYRVRGNYYVVDRLFAAAELRLGQDPQQIVRISRTDGRQASAEQPSSLSTEHRRSEEHTSELQSLMRTSNAVFCLKKKKTHKKR